MNTNAEKCQGLLLVKEKKQNKYWIFQEFNFAILCLILQYLVAFKKYFQFSDLLQSKFCQFASDITCINFKKSFFFFKYIGNTSQPLTPFVSSWTRIEFDPLSLFILVPFQDRVSSSSSIFFIVFHSQQHLVPLSLYLW